MKSASRVRIGTSGWHYKHWLNGFYPAGLPAGKMFPWYAEHFDTVEINNTFYRLPTEEAVKQWRATAPENFVFSVKASRYITHMKRLLHPAESIEKFFERVDLLGETLGPILFQLPPGWKVNAARLEEFLQSLPVKHRYVFEFRDATWASDTVYQLLRQYNAAICFHDWRAIPWPIELTADFAYVRFHGPAGNYSGGYSADVLAGWAKRIAAWDSLKNIWIYFNNDIGGHAIKDAQKLRDLLPSPPTRVKKAA